MNISNLFEGEIVESLSPTASCWVLKDFAWEHNNSHLFTILADQSIYNIEALVNLATSFRVIRAAVTR